MTRSRPLLAVVSCCIIAAGCGGDATSPPPEGRYVLVDIDHVRVPVDLTVGLGAEWVTVTAGEITLHENGTFSLTIDFAPTFHPPTTVQSQGTWTLRGSALQVVATDLTLGPSHSLEGGVLSLKMMMVGSFMRTLNFHRSR
jgi:hypothetical protein